MTRFTPDFGCASPGTLAHTKQTCGRTLPQTRLARDKLTAKYAHPAKSAVEVLVTPKICPGQQRLGGSLGFAKRPGLGPGSQLSPQILDFTPQ
jgi:hypothetical protein